MKTKQRIISAVLAFVMCFSCMSSLISFAAGEVGEEVQKTVATENEWESLKEKLATYHATWTNGNLSGAVSDAMVQTALMGNGDVGVNSDGTSTEKTYRISKQDFWDYDRTNILSVGGVTIRSAEIPFSNMTIEGCGYINTSSTSVGYPLERIIDGKMQKDGDTWACNTDHGTAGHHYFTIDFGNIYALKKYVIHHQGAFNSTSASMNTAEFTVSVSANGTNYETVQTFSSENANTANTTELEFEVARNVRYVKVDITKPMQNNGTVARIAEMAFYEESEAEMSISGCGEMSEYPLANIIDGSKTSYGLGWACNTNHGTEGHHFFTIDLGKEYALKSYELCHQGTVGATNYNTKAFTVYVSSDGTDYEKVQTETSNTASTTTFTLENEINVRYVKVEITDPTQDGTKVGRMGEMRFYDAEGNTLGSEKFLETLSIVDGSLSTDMVIEDVPVSFYNWVSATDNVMITQVTSNGTEAVALESKLFVQTNYASYPLAAGTNSDGTIWVSKTSANSKQGINQDSWKSKVVLMSKVLGAESTTVTNEDGISASLKFTLPAGKTVYILTAVGGGGQNYNWQGTLQGTEPATEASNILAQYTDENSISALKAANDNWWKDYWLKSYVDIGDENIHRYYYGSLYYMACTARENTLPSGIHGIWVTTDNSLWSGDYHLNYNMIAPFYGMYSSNRAEFAKSLKDPLLDYMENGKRKALNDLAKNGNNNSQMVSEYINGGAISNGIKGQISAEYSITSFAGRDDLKNGIADAVLYPVGIGPWGMTCDDYYWMQVYNAGFSAMALTAYYNYTKDTLYFAEVYPFLLANANFYEAWCEKEVFEDGTYRYNIWSGAHEKTFDFNAGTAIGTVKNILECLIDAKEDGAIQIGTGSYTTDTCVNDGVCYVTQEKYNKWVDMYENFADYPVSDGYYGQGVSYSKPTVLLSEQGVKLWKGSANVDLEFVSPAQQVGFDTDPALLEVARNALELKEIANSGIWSQYNNIPKIYLQAIRVGVPAEYIMDRFNSMLDKLMLENYTINDGWSGIERAAPIEFINNMMLQSDNGIIKVFPNWTGNDASFTRLRERGAFIVSSSMRNGRVRDIDVTSEVGGIATFVKPWNNIQILDSDGNAISFTTGMTKNSGEETVSFETVAGESYTLCEIEEENILRGKTVSILGDSISSFEGWSNNANHNSTIGGNEVFYNGSRAGVTSVNEVYWKQLINKYDMELCVNNSSSGSRVVGLGNVSQDTSDQGYENRPYNLHRDVGERVDPDVIIVYIGINDLTGSNNYSYPAGSYNDINWSELIKLNGDSYIYSTPTTVAEAYAIMIHKITVSYPDAEIMIMNLPESTATTANDTMIANLQVYNDFIAKIANRFDATLIDLYGSAMSGRNTYSTYASDGVHPQPYGHDLMTMLLEEALVDIYVKPETYVSSMEQSVTTSSSLNLSEIGDADWIQLGSVSSVSESVTADGVRKNASENLISAVDLVKVENHPDSRFAEGITEYWFTTSWNDGKGNSAVGNNVMSSVLFRGVGSYAQFSVPAKGFDRTLTLSLGVNRAYAELEVWFESNPDKIYSIATIDNQIDKITGYSAANYTNKGGEIVTINFSSTVPGDKLVVRYKITDYDRLNLPTDMAWGCQALIQSIALTGIDPCVNGHTEVIDNAQLPTCTETGLTEGKHCSVCNEVIVAQETVDALGHDMVTDAAVAPTCTETGLTEGSHCSRCDNATTAQEIVPATGHDFADATTETPKTCKTCGATEGDKIPVDSPDEPVQDHSECESNWFAELWNAIINFFRRLFGKPEKCVCGEEI